MDSIDLKPFDVFSRDWALVTAGTPDHYNTMTIGWGGLGTLWGRPVATVYVNPRRYTHSFLDQNDTFTVTFFDEPYREDLNILGTLSGRDGDKVARTKLTPVPVGPSVGFREARLTLLCKKIYRQDMDVSAMPASVAAGYRDEPPHTMFIGEVIDILRR